jgi:serine/threonine protein kinase
VVDGCEEPRKELHNLVAELKFKCKQFPSLEAAKDALADATPSVGSGESQHNIMKNRPGYGGRDWRSHQFADNFHSLAEREQTNVVLLGTTILPLELPLPAPWLDDHFFLALTGSSQQLSDCAKLLPRLPNPGEARECWKAQGINETVQSPFTKEAIKELIMEAVHTCHREEYLLLESIGQGTWGNVFRSKRLGDGRVLALKMVNAKRMQSKYKDAMEREVQFLRELRWPTVLFLLDAWVTGSIQCLLLPLLDGGDLAKVVKAKQPVDGESILDWYAQTLHGLCYLHWRGVVHADIKPGNLLLARCKRLLMIGDFGSARLLPGSGPHPCKRNFVRMPLCTPSHASPESLLQDQHFSGSDIWSVACTFYEVTTLECFLSTAVGEAKAQLAALNFEDLSFGGSLNQAPAAVAALRARKGPGGLTAEILEMWRLEPHKRPSAANLVMRQSVSDRLRKVLIETDSVSEESDHFKDFARIIMESEAAADLAAPAECNMEETEQSEAKQQKTKKSTRFMSNTSKNSRDGRRLSEMSQRSSG